MSEESYYRVIAGSWRRMAEASGSVLSIRVGLKEDKNKSGPIRWAPSKENDIIPHRMGEPYGTLVHVLSGK
jgi:hypothetical protein